MEFFTVPHATRYHDISCGHRVVGHEGKCRFLHGHNYRIHFTCQGNLDKVGRVIDFGVIKSTLCQWLEREWDHKFLVWQEDQQLKNAFQLDETNDIACANVRDSFVWVPFNPTAENIASHLLTVVGPRMLPPEVKLVHVRVEETRKCSAEVNVTAARM
jgi:6-pyruvoyltetrahydropterin/6-carboxytetrahydropterin synthase